MRGCCRAGRELSYFFPRNRRQVLARLQAPDVPCAANHFLRFVAERFSLFSTGYFARLAKSASTFRFQSADSGAVFSRILQIASLTVS